MIGADVIVTGLLSGGFVGAVATLVTSRSVARKTNAEEHALRSRAPAERDNIIVTGAEAAVLTMKAALESAQTRIGELERDRESDRRRIVELEQRIDSLRSRVDVAETALGEARALGDELAVELASLRQPRPRA